MSLNVQIDRFFRWWGGELAAMLPRSLRHASERRLGTLRFEITGTEITVSHGTNGTNKELGRVVRGKAVPTESVSGSEPDTAPRDVLSTLIGRLNASTTRIVVKLAPDLALTKRVVLPLAAEENLRQVLSFEMGRQTPFRAEDVYFDYHILKRDTKARQISVELAAAPRRVVDDALSLLSGWDLQAGGADLDKDGERDGLVLSFFPRASQRHSMIRVNAVLVALNVVLLVAVIAIPLVQGHAELTKLHAELEKAKAAAGKASAMQERVDRFGAEIRFLTERKQRWPATVEVLNELSFLLPDTTWLSRLEVEEGKVQLQGTSDAASSLIARIEESGMFREVRFRSPVTQDARSGRERFQLSARVVGRPESIGKVQSKGEASQG